MSFSSVQIRVADPVMPKCGRYLNRVLPDFTTSHLHLVPVTDDAREHLHALNDDACVMRHLGGRAAHTKTDAEWDERLHGRSDIERSLGYWAGWSAGTFVGWWGLGACSWNPATANLGFRLRPENWGRGLATEGAAALLKHSFNTVGLGSVWAVGRVMTTATGANIDPELCAAMRARRNHLDCTPPAHSRVGSACAAYRSVGVCPKTETHSTSSECRSTVQTQRPWPRSTSTYSAGNCSGRTRTARACGFPESHLLRNGSLPMFHLFGRARRSSISICRLARTSTSRRQER